MNHISLNSLLEKGLLRLREMDRDMERMLNSNKILSILNTYIDEIEYFNPAYGLVRVKNKQELIIKHILDSLSPLGIITRIVEEYGSKMPEQQEVRCIADVGSGAGLPGIPLAIALPDYSFTLIERMGKRAGFLKNVQAVLGCTNVYIEEKEMEKALPARFAFITFRAFRPLEPAILKGLFRLLAPGGALGAYKGRRDKIQEEMSAIERYTGSWEAVPCPVPFLDEERHVVIIQQP